MARSTTKVLLLIAACALLPQVHAEEYPACNVRESRQLVMADDTDEYKLSATVIGSPCYEAELTLSIARYDGQELYRYARAFKPHVVEAWSDSELDIAAIALAKDSIDLTEIQTCSALFSIDREGWNWSRLLVDAGDYERIKTDQCWIFVHPIGTEAIRIVAFSKSWKLAIPLRELGF